eukprot:jgi/Tetstr1/444561/TSEL_000289.t2
MTRHTLRILLNGPNSVGAFRLSLLFAAAVLGTARAEIVLWLFIGNFALDFLDGLLARLLNQATTFGAFLDVLIDNLSRGLLWSWGAMSPWPCFMPLLEMIAFVCTHKVGGKEWKTTYLSEAPWWVKSKIRKK